MSCSAAKVLSLRRVEARRLTLVFTQPSASFGFTVFRFSVFRFPPIPVFRYPPVPAGRR